MSKRLRLLALLVVVVAAGAGAVWLAGGAWLSESVPAARSPRLPDLVSLPLEDFLVATDQQGNEALRFTSSIANVGAGPLIIRARRAFSWNTNWNVVQWFDEADGEPSGRLTGANLVFGGHGHDHWHLQFGASYRLMTEDGAPVASKTKAGFCFFDQVRHDDALPGGPSEGVFVNDLCGTNGANSVEMGMSVGWSDPYYWQLEDQSVVMTGAPDGRYRVEAIADPDGWIMESDETNNGTWALIELGTQPDGLRTVNLIETAPELASAAP